MSHRFAFRIEPCCDALAERPARDARIVALNGIVPAVCSTCSGVFIMVRVDRITSNGVPLAFVAVRPWPMG